MLGVNRLDYKLSELRMVSANVQYKIQQKSLRVCKGHTPAE